MSFPFDSARNFWYETEMTISEVELQKQATELLDLWQKEFEIATGRKPLVSPALETENMRKLIKKSGFEYAKEIIVGYFKTRNEWIKEKGFPIPYLLNNLNEVIAGIPKKVSLEEISTYKEPEINYVKPDSDASHRVKKLIRSITRPLET